MRSLAAFALIAILATAATETRAACECPNAFDLEGEPGIIWRGEEPITLDEIAHIAAPVMWFSPDEPLLLSGMSTGLPDPHPCDEKPAENGVVYYQPYFIRLNAGAEPVSKPFETDPEFFTKVNSFLLRYYFYYQYDYGFDGHEHDIEIAIFQLVPERTLDGCYQLRLLEVECMAHGVDWYNNILTVEHDTRFPIHILVEEAKHASCPDRNADGHFTPGYDVTKHINDAWGVRDVLGSGYLLGASFKASMAKARLPVGRNMPPAHDGRCPTLGSWADSFEPMGQYDLRPGTSLTMCEGVSHGEHLEEMMTRHRLGSDHEPEQIEANSLEDLTNPISKPGKYFPSISYRYDGAAFSGLSFIFRGLDGGEFWLVPRFNFHNKALSVEGLVTSSASRWFDTYFAAGAEWWKAQKAEIGGEEVTLTDSHWEAAIETGVKFRFRVPGKIKPVMLFHQFGGVRFGVRTNRLDQIQNLRFIFEIGAGVF
jgi:hypothetical protein